MLQQQNPGQQQTQNLHLQPGMDNRMQLLLEQRQMLEQQQAGQTQAQAPQQKTGNEGSSSDLLEGDLDANLGMNDDDLLGDFGDDFNILEFADDLDGNDSNKINILDDLEAEEDGDGNKKGDGTQSGEAKPPPYVP